MKNILILTIVIIGFISCSNPTQKKAERTEISLDSIKVKPNWEDESVIDLELKKTRTIKRNGRSQSVTSTSKVELFISKKDNNNWNGIWRIKDIHTPSINNPLEKKIEKLVNGFVYNFTLDSTGIILELTNWRDIQSKGFEALELIIEEINDQPGMNPQMIEHIKMNVGEMFNSKEKIETFLMQDVQLYFALGGIEMTKSDTIVGYTFIAHPLTGDLITQYINTVYQKAYSDSTCVIQITQSVDESDLFDAVKNTVSKVAEDKTDEFHKRMSDVKFDAKIISDFNISLKTGLVDKVISQKEITIGNDVRIDKTEITRK